MVVGVPTDSTLFLCIPKDQPIEKVKLALEDALENYVTLCASTPSAGGFPAISEWSEDDLNDLMKDKEPLFEITTLIKKIGNPADRRWSSNFWLHYNQGNDDVRILIEKLKGKPNTKVLEYLEGYQLGWLFGLAQAAVPAI